MTKSDPATSSTPPHYRPGAAILAWILPGLGHIVLGQKRRGGLIMFGIFFLVGCGVLIGGIDVVDRKQDRLWFIAQAGNGPITFLLDYVKQSQMTTTAEFPTLPGNPSRVDWDKVPQSSRTLASLGNINSTGTLYIALAGLMNLVVILDAFAGPDRANDAPARRSSDA